VAAQAQRLNLPGGTDAKPFSDTFRDLASCVPTGKVTLRLEGLPFGFTFTDCSFPHVPGCPLLPTLGNMEAEILREPWEDLEVPRHAERAELHSRPHHALKERGVMLSGRLLRDSGHQEVQS
jgi:hypothetical protein